MGVRVRVRVRVIREWRHKHLSIYIYKYMDIIDIEIDGIECCRGSTRRMHGYVREHQRVRRRNEEPTFGVG